MNMMVRKFFIPCLLLLASFPLVVCGQSVTYIHDEDFLQQFLFVEDGSGQLSPETYYNAFHNGYRNEYMTKSKNFFRGMKTTLIKKDEFFADSVENSMYERSESEAFNMVDRNSTSGELAYGLERRKIERQMDLMERRINKIMGYGGSAQLYNDWMDRYRCCQYGLQEVQDAYMPLSYRKAQYLAIYRDLVAKNGELYDLLTQLKFFQPIDVTCRPINRFGVGRACSNSYAFWKGVWYYTGVGDGAAVGGRAMFHISRNVNP